MILVIFLIFYDALILLGSIILFPLEEYPNLELIVVMILVPLVLNAVQYWVIDTFLKLKETKSKNYNKDEPGKETSALVAVDLLQFD
mmetsp:Transcript_43073/g.31449  ORF Transcript_43073/g.31449 Transcript_43073/m.31449 type:complete len:87 (+) Transcript_43073:579-839(+)|eukprot:CAMPEP_0202961414 /NCGR_PEP_ID=MMETSP1396-20130829/5464_1 /ASSEMBLY_ACC=CAM_ASM_000872 /TAXON_ID= /ORGANISM="Pseudokeronopsis sp., Strain Brazil" /LENGTH=86 /DNA_ID=CAMNT_0049681205 /DNA_START=471 /DNA_END=731 /DNA_ORIENTATION=-